MDELVAAQQLLGRSLGKARAGEDKELSGRVRDGGETVAQMLGGALKMSRVHAADNKAFDMPVGEMVKALRVLNELIGTVHLVTVDEQAYVNDVALRAEGKPSIRELGGELRKHNVGGMTFHAPLSDSQVRAVVAGFSAQPVEPMPRTALRTRLESAGVTSVELHGIYRFRTSAEKGGGASRALGPESPRTAPSSPSGLRPSSPSGVRTGSPSGQYSSSSSGLRTNSPSGQHTSSPSGVRASSPSGQYAGSASGIRAGAPSGQPVSSPSGLRSAGPGGQQASSASGLRPAPPGGSPASASGAVRAISPASADPLMAAAGGPALDAADTAFESGLGARAMSVDGVVERAKEPGSSGSQAKPPFETLDRLATLAASAWAALSTGRSFSPLPLRRAVAEVLETGASAPGLWDAWVTGPTRSNHAVSVTLHSLLLGDAAGLSVAALQDLGVAALVHDIGYAALVGTPHAQGAEGLWRHPGEGARLLLRQRGFSHAKVRRLRAVLEHHRAWNSPDRPSVLGGILRLADDYLGFLRLAAAQTTAVHVLGAMAQDPSEHYHPVLLQLFVNALGQFPPGVLLGLEDGRRVRSVSVVRNPDRFELPLVREVDAQTGKTFGPPLVMPSKVTAVYPG